MVQYAPHRANLVAEIGNGHPVLAFSGHEDVVDAVGDWNTDPFQLTGKYGKLYGRETCDMKSGVAAMIIAMIELKQSEMPYKGTIRLLITLGEEVGEFGAEQLTEQGFMDDVDGLIIGEPTGYKICYAHKGSLDIKLKAMGKIAHSSMPDLGNNALQNMLDLVTLINQEIGDTEIVDPETGKFLFNFTVMQGGTQVNSIPGTTEVQLNSRTIDDFSNEKVINIIENAIKQLEKTDPKYQFDMEILMNLPPVDGDKNNSLIKLGQKIGEAVTDQKIPLFGGSYTTDAAKFLVDKPDDFPMIIFGPGNQSLHSSNEYIDESMYFNFIEIYKQLMIEGLK
ncbi:ArgE/DapE family deacylase [Fructilactobacillus sanfranciscensis]|uniref:ArgE/DapE family deacylase n=1 Tax=Fructilactobacillus sanfranciscensis TaxID=1625 RepID=UPI000CD3B1EE|nr:ArgE/DapE family deacylase [Fructilactobacillus sanfranciscensis]